MLINTGTITANGNYGQSVFKGGELFLHLDGTFGSSTVTLQISYDSGATYIPVSAANAGAFTASAINRVILPDCVVRLVVTDSTSPSIKYALAVRAPV